MYSFETNYLDRVINLLKEICTFKKYKAMHPALAVATIIFMLPFIISSALTALFLIVLTFCFNAVKMPIDYMHGLLRSEGQEVKHGTQVVLYFISWPFVFFAYAYLSFSLLLITFMYAYLSLVSYVWTLGGFKFHAFIGTEHIDLEVPVDDIYNILTPLIYVVVCGAILFFQIISAIHVYVYYMFGFAIVALILMLVYYLFTIFYVALLYARQPRSAYAVQNYLN